MTDAREIFAEGEAPAGWFGKLPGMGDFAQRRLPSEFRDGWDQWLQFGLMQLRQQRADWTERYLQSPLWFFVLGRRVLGPYAWVGVLMPSVDGVGRYFPFSVARALSVPLSQLQPSHWPLLWAQWQHMAQSALHALELDLDAAGVDALLAMPVQPTTPPTESSRPPPWPEDGHSLWLTNVSAATAPALHAAGLPRGLRFEHLFGFDDAANALPLP